MLSPNDRRLYSDCFTAPPGMVFDCAVGTTYSLDLASLLFVPYCLAANGARDPDSALRDPIALLESIHRIAGRVTVFCHDGETNAPQPASALYSLLESSVVPARGRAGGAIFHPKLWILRFTDREKDNVVLRVVILSRNLTASRAWDTVACFDGTPFPKQSVPESKGLRELLLALPKLASAGLPSAPRQEQLALLATEVGRTRFDAPAPFEGVAAFQAIGLEPNRGFSPQETGNRMLAVSPFVSSGTLTQLAELAPRRELISRAEELSKCEPGVLEPWRCFTLDESASPDAEEGDSTEVAGTIDPAPRGLHAKALAVESGRQTVWWLGSGNLTDPVRSGSSVEVMVRLEGKTSKVGIDTFHEGGFAKLLQEYTYSPLAEDEQSGNRALAEKAKAALVDADLVVSCFEQVSGWVLELTGMFAPPSGVRLSCRPITLPVGHAIRVVSNGPAVSFSGLAVESLTAFIAFSLEAGEGPSAFSVQFTRRLPVNGLPADRDARITQSFIRNRSAFLAYLRCLLGDVAPLAT
jgi:hypothetical protein